MRSIGTFVPPIVLRCLSRGQLVEQPLRLFQIERVEPFGEPPVDRSEKLTRLIPLALIAPEPRHSHCGAELQDVGSSTCSELLFVWQFEPKHRSVQSARGRPQATIMGFDY